MISNCLKISQGSARQGTNFSRRDWAVLGVAGRGETTQDKIKISTNDEAKMNTNFRTKDTIHVDAAIILARLKSAKPGEVVNYSDLSSMIGRNVQAEARYIMETARRHAKKERIYFGVVTNVGLQRLDDSGKVKVGSGMMSKIRRTTRRAAQTLAAVEDFNSLPNELKIEHNTALSVFGILTQATSKKLQTKISERVEGVEGGVLAMKKSFELFA